MRVPELRRLAPLVLVPALALRCGAAAPELSHTLSPRASALLSRAPTVYAPADPGGATGENAALRATFEAALEPAARSRLHHDPALDLVAAAVAENFSDQNRGASRALMQWMLWKSGSLAVYQGHSGGWLKMGRSTRGELRQPGGRASLEEWAKQAAEHANATPTSHLSYGLARFTEGRVTAESIVFGWEHFEALSFAKTYAPGGPLTLALRPRTPLQEIRFLLDTGDAVQEQTLAPRADGSFFVSQVVPMKPGRYFIELQGPAPRRATLLAVPIYVGVPEAAVPDDFIQHPPAGPADVGGWGAWLGATYNAERARAGKPPLEVDARLEALAAERSALVASGQRVAALESEAVSARLGAAGIAPGGCFETITTADGTDAVLLSLLRPSMRRRVVLGDRVRLGAGAAARAVEKDRPQSFTLVEEAVSGAGAP